MTVESPSTEAPSAPGLRYETRGRVAYLTLDRPRAMNALNREVMQGLTDAVHAFQGDDNLLVAVLTGEGGRAFSAGADLKEVAARAGGGGTKGMVPRQGSLGPFDALENCWKPVIAAIDGYCLAGGFELALMCDIRVATRASTFGLPEPRRSLLAGPGLNNLSRMIPLGEALRMQLTGSPITAERAYQIGLVQELADDRDELFAVADRIAGEVMECAPLAVQAIKQIVKVGRNLPIEYAWKYSYPFQERISQTEDFLEGPRAFAEKRQPNWRVR
jgi:enoyl-CoA hydratase/carnithine racemase